MFLVLWALLAHANAYQTGTAPFCSMDDVGNTSCIYYTRSACTNAIKLMRGYSCVHK